MWVLASPRPAVLRMSSGLQVFCSDKTFCLQHGMLTGESAQITAWSLNRESVYTRAHAHTNKLVGVHCIEGTYMFCALTVPSLSVLSLLTHSHNGFSGLNPVVSILVPCFVLSNVVWESELCQALWWHYLDKWLKLPLWHKMGNDQTPDGQKKDVCFFNNPPITVIAKNHQKVYVMGLSCHCTYCALE